MTTPWSNGHIGVNGVGNLQHSKSESPKAFKAHLERKNSPNRFQVEPNFLW